MPAPRLMACTLGSPNPAARFRVLQYLPYLRDAGWQVYHRPSRPRRYNRTLPSPNPLLTCHHKVSRLLRHFVRLRDIRQASAFDVIWINRDLFHSNPAYEKKLYTRNPRVIYDFDDALFMNDKMGHTDWCCTNAGWVIAGNHYLAEYALRHTDRVSVIPTVVDVGRYDTAVGNDTGDLDRKTLRVGWCGSNLSIRQTLYPMLDTFRRLQERLGFEFVVMTRPKPHLPSPSLKWSYVRWSEWEEVRLRHHMDIGVMPLVDDSFQRGKCGLKILQYMASGLPSVASPVGINKHLVKHGERGFLASGEAEWQTALGELITDGTLRTRLGESGKHFCERHYSLQAWLPELIRIFDKVGNRPAARHDYRTE